MLQGPTRESASSHLTYLVFDHTPRLSNTKKITIIALDVIWTGLSIAICVPPAEAALHFNTGHSLTKAIVADVSAVGCFIDWGSLTAWGGIELIHAILRDRPLQEKLLTQRNTPILLRTGHIALSVILGLGSRSPAVAVALKFTHSWRWGIFCAVIESGLPDFSSYKLLQKMGEKSLSFLRKDNRVINAIQSQLVNEVSICLCRVMTLSVEERAQHFRIIYLTELNLLQGPDRRIQLLFKEITEFNQTGPAVDVNKLKWIKYSKTSLRALFSILSVGLLVQNALLANSAAKSLDDNTALSVLAINFAVFPMLWAALNIPGDCAAHFVDLLMDAFSVPRENQTFSEIFYPRLSRSLQCLALLISLLPYGEIETIAREYASWDTYYGSVFITSNVVTLSLMITNSLIDFIDAGLTYAASKKATQEIKDVVFLNQKLQRLRQLLEEMPNPQLTQFLNRLDDPELKQYIVKKSLKDQELQSLAYQLIEEETPLLIGS